METPAEDREPITHLSRREMETLVTDRELTVHLTRRELQQMMEEAGRNALVAYERRTATPLEREVAGKRLFQEGVEGRDNEGMSKRGANKKGPPPSEVGSSSRALSRPRGPAISRAEVDDVSKQIALLGKQIDELKKRGEIVAHNRNSPFANQILIEMVNPSFRMPDLPKYNGTRDPQEHLAAFDMVMNLYGQSSSIVAKLFVTTLTGKAQEWFTNLPPGSIESYEQLVQKFAFHFASKRKQKRSATHLFTIQQGENESLKSFMGRFNNETLEVQDLRIDMMTSILIHGLKKGVFASALARDPPIDTEQLMAMAQKYIDEEEMNAMKDEEWRVTSERARDGRFGRDHDVRPKREKEKEPPYQSKYNKYTPLNMTRAKALMLVEKDNVLIWPKHTRITPAKRFEPNFENFWSLYSFTTSVQSGDNGFFYLTSRKECRFLDPLTSNVGPWKSKFIFVKPPPGREWPFSLDWKVDKPTPLVEGEGLDGDQISSITTYRYNPKKILVEEILWLAHLTPAPLQVEGTLGDPISYSLFFFSLTTFNGTLIIPAVSMVSQACINKHLRAQFQAQAQARAATQLASSSQPVPAASSTPDADVPPCPVPIEVGSEETQSRGLLPPNQPTVRSHSWRLQDRTFDDGDFDESSWKRKSRGKSPLRPNLMGTQSQSGEGGLPSDGTGSETMRSMDVLRGITECWRNARLDLRGPDHPVAHMEGDKWIPDWQISPQSSVFRTCSNQDSWELYDASCLPRDQSALLQTSFTRMEEHCAHSLVQAANFVRGLSLKCAGFRHNQLTADRTIRDLRTQLTAFFAKEEEWSRSRSIQEARIKELEAQVASEASKAAAEGEKRGFEAGHAAGKIAGVLEGRETFLRSEEFAQQVRGIRLQGVRDFLKTPTFDSAVEVKAADYLMQGFDRCKSQTSLLHGLLLTLTSLASTLVLTLISSLCLRRTIPQPLTMMNFLFF
ncbi:UNVERIFIED_CONTAM: hypothetical protein Sindi_0815600 [Sesamum indicum]